MNPLCTLHRVGQSVRTDGITRAMLDSGALERDVRDFCLTHERTAGVDGWSSFEVSPPLRAYGTQASLRSAGRLSQRFARPKLRMKLPGTPPGLTTSEEALFTGVPVNVTLLFSHEHCLEAANAHGDAGADASALADRAQREGAAGRPERALMTSHRDEVVRCRSGQ